jgi:hypothetical protein
VCPEQKFSTGVPREFGGKPKKSEKTFRNKKIIEIHNQHYFK